MGHTQNRLRWRCRRGLLELDLWLQHFAETELERLTPEECIALESLLGESDADLMAWLEGRQDVPWVHVPMIERIRSGI